MTNPPKDLDQGDVNADAITMYEKEIEELGEELDGCDLFTVISIVADSVGDFLPEALGSSLYKDLIRATQSNPEKAYTALLRMIELDNAIAEL